MATILVVDDDANTRVFLSTVLGYQLGHELVFAKDGQAGIETYRRTDPDLVITDLVMPGSNGLHLIERLKEAYPTSKIIAVSGKGPEQLERAQAVGAVAALTKPIQRDELVAAVGRALAREASDPGKRTTGWRAPTGSSGGTTS